MGRMDESLVGWGLSGQKMKSLNRWEEEEERMMSPFHSLVPALVRMLNFLTLFHATSPFLFKRDRLAGCSTTSLLCTASGEWRDPRRNSFRRKRGGRKEGGKEKEGRKELLLTTAAAVEELTMRWCRCRRRPCYYIMASSSSSLL